MTQFYILEIQQNAQGEFSHLVHWAFDQDPTQARLKAESTYHTVLAAQAVSDLKSHSATLIASDGRAIMNQCYVHAVTTELETEPEE